MDHEDTIGAAYAAGMRAAKGGQAVASNPYYTDSQQCIAFVSGYRDQVAWQEARDGKPE